MPYDLDKIDDVTLALLHLVTHRRHQIGPWRAWKGFDWDTMDRLHEKGFIGDPVGKAKSVVLTDEGYERSLELFEQFFGLEDAEGGPSPSNPEELVGHDTFLDYELEVDDALRTELADAIEGRGAFSRFRRVLNGHEPLRQAWFSFRDARAQKRMRDWLAIEDYELVEEE